MREEGEYMRRLIDYIRSCFCKHEWEVIHEVDIVWDEYDSVPMGRKWTSHCKKCGSFKTYKNY